MISENNTQLTHKRAFSLSRLENVTFNTVNIILLTLLAFVTLYPFWNTVAISLNEASDTVKGGISLFPREVTLYNYKAVFASGSIPHAFFISVSRTVIATILSVFLTSMLAYTLSRSEFIFLKPFTMIMILSMYLNAGLIPYYFLVRDLGLVNKFWVYIFNLGLLSAFNFIMVRTFMKNISDSLIEAAKIDGAGDFYIFMKIMLPLSKPVLATIALFVAVGNWNQWFDNMIFTSSRQDLSTLQFELMKLLQASQNQSKSAAEIGSMANSGGRGGGSITPMSMRAAMTIVASLPILFVYPFLQKHFVMGIQLGGVKG